MNDVFAVQDEIAHSTDNLEAYNLYLTGRHLFENGFAFKDSLQRFEQAVEADSGYAHAQAGRALAYMVMAAHGSSDPREVMPQAKEAAARAIALDETVADAHYSLAMVRQAFDWDWSGAARDPPNPGRCTPPTPDRFA